jgi:hypothetical protein
VLCYISECVHASTVKISGFKNGMQVPENVLNYEYVFSSLRKRPKKATYYQINLGHDPFHF